MNRNGVGELLFVVGAVATFFACSTEIQTDTVILRRSRDAGVLDARPSADGEPFGFHPWASTSVRLSIDTNSYWSGQSHYENSRGEMSADQLAVLDALVAKGPRKGRVVDSAEARVRITDADGTVATYRSSPDGSYGASSLEESPTLPWDALASFACLSSAATESREEVPVPDPWALAPIARYDVGCFHAVTKPPPCGHAWVKVVVSEPGDYRLETSSCQGSMKVHVFDAKHTSELAFTESVDAPSCPELEHQFASAGTYLLDFERTDCAGPNDFAVFSFRFVRR